MIQVNWRDTKSNTHYRMESKGRIVTLSEDTGGNISIGNVNDMSPREKEIHVLTTVLCVIDELLFKEYISSLMEQKQSVVKMIPILRKYVEKALIKKYSKP